MIVNLRTNDESHTLSFDEITNSSCFIKVKSGVFQSSIVFNYYEDTWFMKFLEEISKLRDGSISFVELEDEMNNCISFTTNALGHLLIEGELKENFEFEQILKFGFKTDRTCLDSFVSDLNSAITSSTHI